MAFKQSPPPDVYGLDDAAYRDYSRAQLARARKRANPGGIGKSLDLIIAVILLIATIVLVMWDMGNIPTSITSQFR